MAAFTLEEILSATEGTLLRKGGAARVTGISTDSRSLAAGELFIPLVGENFDGHAFLEKAAERGAAAVLVSDAGKAEILPENVTVIAVSDTLAAFEALARFHRLRFSIPVIGVTGSSGKTTTKDMTAAVLGSALRTRHTEKNFNNEIGLSQTLLGLTEADEACVVEMGMRGFGQIAELCRTARPTVGIVTNVGTAHIGLLGSRENIGKAKAELIEALPETGVAILNGDDPLTRKMGENFRGRVIYYGVEAGNDLRAAEIHFTNASTDFTVISEKEKFSVSLPLLGLHNVYDALAAAAAGLLLGVSTDGIRAALENFKPQGDRQKLYEIGGVIVLDDSYNANPLSVEMAMKALLQLPAKRRVLVLGDMLELGNYEEELHRGIGKTAAAEGFDALVAVGPLSRFTAESARAAGMAEVMCALDAAEAAEILKQHTRAGDAVLIKGSHAMHLETIAGLWKGDGK